jgi:hypothetical protein
VEKKRGENQFTENSFFIPYVYVRPAFKLEHPLLTQLILFFLLPLLTFVSSSSGNKGVGGRPIEVSHPIGGHGTTGGRGLCRR